MAQSCNMYRIRRTSENGLRGSFFWCEKENLMYLKAVSENTSHYAYIGETNACMFVTNFYFRRSSNERNCIFVASSLLSVESLQEYGIKRK